MYAQQRGQTSPRGQTQHAAAPTREPLGDFVFGNARILLGAVVTGRIFLGAATTASLSCAHLPGSGKVAELSRAENVYATVC